MRVLNKGLLSTVADPAEKENFKNAPLPLPPLSPGLDDRPPPPLPEGLDPPLLTDVSTNCTVVIV